MSNVIDRALGNAVGTASIVSAIVGDENGDVVAATPGPAGSIEATGLAEWAAERLAEAVGLRNLFGEDRFSLLHDREVGPTKLHCHLEPVGRHHILVFLFKDRDRLPDVRSACAEAAAVISGVLNGA